MISFKTDWDRTLFIHQNSSIMLVAKCIEILDDKEISYMLYLSIELINKIKIIQVSSTIPITTRSYAHT